MKVWPDLPAMGTGMNSTSCLIRRDHTGLCPGQVQAHGRHGECMATSTKAKANAHAGLVYINTSFDPIAGSSSRLPASQTKGRFSSTSPGRVEGRAWMCCVCALPSLSRELQARSGFSLGSQAMLCCASLRMRGPPIVPGNGEAKTLIIRL